MIVPYLEEQEQAPYSAIISLFSFLSFPTLMVFGSISFLCVEKRRRRGKRGEGSKRSLRVAKEKRPSLSLGMRKIGRQGAHRTISS